MENHTIIMRATIAAMIVLMLGCSSACSNTGGTKTRNQVMSQVEQDISAIWTIEECHDSNGVVNINAQDVYVDIDIQRSQLRIFGVSYKIKTVESDYKFGNQHYIIHTESGSEYFFCFVPSGNIPNIITMGTPESRLAILKRKRGNLVTKVETAEIAPVPAYSPKAP